MNPSCSAPSSASARHAAAAEDHFARVAGAHAELVFLAPRRHPGVAAFDDERRDAAMGARLVGDGHHHDHVADAAVGDERLGPVNHPAVAVAGRRRAEPRGVRSRGRLGQPPGANPRARGQRHEVAPLLRLGAEHGDVRCAQAVVGRHRQRHRRVDARQFLDADAVLDRGHRGPAVFLVELDAHQAERRHLRDKRPRKRLNRVPFAHERADLGLGELADGAAQHLLLLGGTEVHQEGM